MTLPKGPVWQKLRADCLDSIPGGSRFPYTTPRPLSTWYKTGLYTLGSIVPNKLSLRTSADEIGAALLSDSEHLLDCAAEHHAMLAAVSSNNNKWESPVWAAVTGYYWSLFCALAFGRLIGQTIWYLDKEAVHHFNGLAPTGSSRIGPGSYKLKCAPIVTTEREIILSRTKGRLHEVIWAQMFGYLGTLYTTFGDQGANQLEYRLFSSIQKISGRLGMDWPSAVRNVVNYVPGCAYNEVRRANVMDTVRFIRRLVPMSGEELISQLESAGLALGDIRDVRINPAPFSRLVIVFAFVLDSLCRELHDDLYARRSFDSRWVKARFAFLGRTGVVTGKTIWPYASLP